MENYESGQKNQELGSSGGFESGHGVSARENVEASKIEWGPELGQMSWYDAHNEIIRLNNSDHEKRRLYWRLPTVMELREKFTKTDPVSEGFSPGDYWSGTICKLPHPPYRDDNYSYRVSTYGGLTYLERKDAASPLYENGRDPTPQIYVRPVRDIL